MTKKKIGVLLSSIVAGLGLVGATFALWAVTDNADPFGIKISPSDIQDDSYNTIVLEWGDKTQFKNIGGLGLGETNAKYISVGVKSTSTSSTVTGGNLSLALEDRTSNTSRTTEKLIDHLVVKTYTDSEHTSEIGALALNGATPKLNSSSNVSTSQNGTETTLYFKVYIDSNGLTPAKYDEMKEDMVFLTVDWNRPSSITNDDLVGETTTIYYNGSLAQPYVYAWSSTTLKANGEFPGVAMTPVQGVEGYYSYELKASYDRIIFSSTNAGLNQTEDLNAPTEAGKTLYVSGSGSSTVWGTPTLQQQTYWLIGTMNDWTSNTTGYQFTFNTDHYELNGVTTTVADSEFKVITGDNMKYWGEHTKGGSGDTQVVELGLVGTYNISFYPNATGTDPYIVCAQQI